MTMTETRLPGEFARSGLMVPDAAAVLKRMYFLGREFVRLQAAWMPGTVHWETKLLLPEFLWQDELTAWQLRERVLELRYPERRIEPGEDSECIAFFQQLGQAPSAEAFAGGWFEVVKPAIARAYEAYLTRTDTLDDAPTVRILRHALEDIEFQREGYTAVADETDQTWQAAVRRAFATLGDDWWNPQATADFQAAAEILARAGAPLRIARRGARDPRFSRALFSWPDSLDPARGAGQGFELQVRQAQAHLNEVWAAEMAAACINDLMDEAPAEFLHDAARWCFDEIRHCRMGYTRLRDWGLSDRDMPMGSYSYDLGEDLDPVTRLGVIFYFETTYIHTKSERTKSFAAFGDRTSSHDMDFDWADELIHTHYGKKWLNFFLEREGRGRKAADIKQAAFQAVEAIRARATPADAEATESLYRRTMERARELALQAV